MQRRVATVEKFETKVVLVWRVRPSAALINLSKHGFQVCADGFLVNMGLRND